MDEEVQHSSNGFWFGLLMGGAFGAAGLYFLGTEQGRDKLRAFIDTIEDMDENTLDSIRESLSNPTKTSNKVVGDIHSVLDKIQSTMPDTEEVKKYFTTKGKKVKK